LCMTWPVGQRTKRVAVDSTKGGDAVKGYYFEGVEIVVVGGADGFKRSFENEVVGVCLTGGECAG